MNHLTAEQLNALADDALAGRARAEAERHLADCAACREALAGLLAQDEALRSAITHEPGEAYFEDFGPRVEGRIRAEGLKGAQARGAGGRGLAEWFRSPRKLAWVGTVAAVVVVAGIVIITGREVKGPLIPSSELARRSDQVAPPLASQQRLRGVTPGAGAPPAEETGEMAGAAERELAARTTMEDREIASAPAAGFEARARLMAGRTETAPTPAATSERAMHTTTEMHGIAAPLAREKREGAPAAATSAASTPVRGAAPTPALGAAPVPAPATATGGAPIQLRGTPPVPETGTPHDQRGPAPPERAYEVRKNEAGEDVPVRRPGEFQFVQPPAAEPPAKPGEPVRVRKPRYAEPMGAEPKQADALKQGVTAKSAEAPKSLAEPMPRYGGARPATDEDVAVPAPVMKEHAAAAGLRICGTVRDAAGRPVAGAQVANAALGVSAATAADGSFCVDARTGEQSLSVMAVGFKPLRRTVVAGPGAPAQQLALEAVPVVGESRPMAVLQAQGAAQAFEGLAPAPRAQAQRAQQLSAEADRRQSAVAYDRAAVEWGRLVAQVKGGALESETRWQLAAARYRAWQASPDVRRKALATAALDAYLAGAPAGAQRDEAKRWLKRVRK
ncbi:MAG: carboxypeptidase regulatory-like domain-containing protein [Candidatus Eisenbacteria bacterium]|nr:carboxypeptidase regulatory-like domain-containing protein [Candidatus Eisenbacteria bacterium]